MLNKLKKENESFMKMWKSQRKSHFKGYYLRKIVSTFIFVILLYVLNCIVSDDFDYLLSFIIYLLIAIFAPIISWTVNEFRYNISLKKKG